VTNANRPTTWLTVKEMAQMLRVSDQTIYRLIDNHELPAYRFGRQMRLKAQDVAAYIEKSRAR
jgi:putative molybdopterin biosynthesis protein